MPKINCLGFFESEITSFYKSANFRKIHESEVDFSIHIFVRIFRLINFSDRLKKLTRGLHLPETCHYKEGTNELMQGGGTLATC